MDRHVTQTRPSRVSSSDSGKRYLPIILSLTVGILVSIGLYIFVHMWEEERTHNTFKAAAEDRAIAIERALKNKIELVTSSMSAFFQAVGTDVGPEMFKNYVMPLISKDNSIKAVEWIPFVSADKRAEFLTTAQKIYPNFQINELNTDSKIISAAQRDSYLPLLYIQPIEGNEVSIGLDISADKNRRALLSAARDSGEPLAISHLTIAPDTTNQSGSVIFLPIYKPNAPQQTIAQRRDAFAGFVMAVYLVGDVLDVAMKTLEPRPIDIRVFDYSEDIEEDARFLHFLPGQVDESILAKLSEAELNQDFENVKLKIERKFPIGGRTLTVICSAAPGYHLLSGYRWQAMTVLISGLFITLLLALYFHNSMRHAYLMAEAAESANLAQSRFLANMSHQLRTPLNAIIGYSELVREEVEDTSNSAIASDVDRIYISAKYLLSMSDGILDLSKIKTGKIELHSETCKIIHLVEEVESIATVLSRQNGNTLVVNCPSDIGTMQTDLTRLHQVLFNLINNASEATENGQITLDVSRELEAGKEWIRFSVRDTSGGMPTERREWLLKALAKADPHASGGEQSVRLGLAISSHFWQMMHGRFDIEVEPGKGTTYVLKLPAHNF